MDCKPLQIGFLVPVVINWRPHGHTRYPPPGPAQTQRLSDNAATGRALKRLRKLADLTQQEAAAKVGVVVQSWRRYEWGERDIGLTEMRRLAEALGSTLEDFLAIRAGLLAGADEASHCVLTERVPEDVQ